MLRAHIYHPDPCPYGAMHYSLFKLTFPVNIERLPPWQFLSLSLRRPECKNQSLRHRKTRSMQAWSFETRGNTLRSSRFTCVENIERGCDSCAACVRDCQSKPDRRRDKTHDRRVFGTRKLHQGNALTNKHSSSPVS